MTRVAVDFQGERAEFETAEDRLVGVWRGPAGLPPEEIPGMLLESLQRPVNFPPLSAAVVPGDRVVIALDHRTPEAPLILRTLRETLEGAGVEADSIEILATGPLPGGGDAWTIHDPDDRSRLAYLASTEDGRRIYLNRSVIDADLVIPVGGLGYDGVLGYRGPWSSIFPGMSDSETRRSFQSRTTDDPADRVHERANLVESTKVSWLLGSQFQLGVVPGTSGAVRFVGGIAEEVRSRGEAAVDLSWSFRASSRADLVVAGIGLAAGPTSLDELVAGLATASRLVRRGGKIAALSRAEGQIGAALGRIAGADDPVSALRGREMEADYYAARTLANVLAWADVYLLSGLDDGLVEDLGMIPLGRASEAQRLTAASPSTVFISQADQTRAEAEDEP